MTFYKFGHMICHDIPSKYIFFLNKSIETYVNVSCEFKYAVRCFISLSYEGFSCRLNLSDFGHCTVPDSAQTKKIPEKNIFKTKKY